MLHGTIIIDENRCKSCQFCVLFCPKQLISINEKALNLAGYYPAQLNDPDNQCTACGVCALVCPDVCITVLRESKVQASTSGARED